MSPNHHRICLTSDIINEQLDHIPSSSVKVVTLTITHKNMTAFDASITDYEFDRSTLNLNSDASITGKLDRTVQIGHGTRTRIARMNAIYSEHVCYI